MQRRAAEASAAYARQLKQQEAEQLRINAAHEAQEKADRKGSGEEGVRETGRPGSRRRSRR